MSHVSNLATSASNMYEFAFCITDSLYVDAMKTFTDDVIVFVLKRSFNTNVYSPSNPKPLANQQCCKNYAGYVEFPS